MLLSHVEVLLYSVPFLHVEVQLFTVQFSHVEVQLETVQFSTMEVQFVVGQLVVFCTVAVVLDTVDELVVAAETAKVIIIRTTGSIKFNS